MLRIEQDLVLAIEPECYRRWLEEARAHAGDTSLLEKVHAPDAAARLEPGKKSVGDIAVIRLSGFITQKVSLMTLLFGGTSTEALTGAIQAAMAEPSIGAVVLDVDSPGGIVFGVPEAAAAIRAARGGKPFVSVANALMASAAYYLGSQADEVVATPSALVGSIGVKVMHIDESKAIEQAGLTVTEITYGRRKTEESGVKPLTKEAHEAIQARVDYYGKLFDSDVAKGRRIPVPTVRANFGEGAVFTAQDAKAAGMVDRVATLDEVIGGLAHGQKPGPRMYREELAAHAALAGITLEEERN